MGTRGRGEGLVIKDVGAVKALADPLRHHLLTLLDRPRSVKELAAETGRPPDRLYYHLGLLERHGLVRVAEGDGRERRYQAAADVMTIDPNLVMPRATVSNLINGILQRAQREYAAAGRLRKRGAKGKKQTLLALGYYVLTDEQYEELVERVRGVLDDYAEFRPAHPPTEDEGRVFGLMWGTWPAVDEGG